MEIAIVGVGGVGGYFGGLLAKKGLSVHLIARGRHLSAIRSDGLRVEAAAGAFTVHPTSVEPDGRAIPHCDVVFLAVKNYDFDAAWTALRAFLGERACFVPLLNGVDAVQKLSGELPDRTLGGQCSVLAEIVAPGVIRQAKGPQQVVLGELDHRHTDRLRMLGEAFAGTGADIVLSDAIEMELWTKLIYISCLAGVVALTRSSVGEVLSCPEARSLYVSALEEAAAVAEAEGVALGPALVQRMMARAEALEPGTKFSLLRDLEARHRTEIESLHGTLVRRGRAKAVATPVLTFMYAALLPAHLRGCSAAPSA